MNSVIELIRKDAAKHTVSVIVPGGENVIRKLFLILISAKTSLLNDFKITYGREVTAIHAKIAKKMFGTKETENIYGVLLDDEMRMVFAFNTKFADYKGKNIVYKDMDSILMENIKPAELDVPKKIAEKIAQMLRYFDSDFPRNRCTGGRMSYSIPEPKNRKK